MANKRHKSEPRCMCGARYSSADHGPCHLDQLSGMDRLRAAACIVHHQFVEARGASTPEVIARSRDERSEAYRTKYSR